MLAPKYIGLTADAEALLTKYLPGTFTPTQSEGAQASGYFRLDTPSKGIPLTDDFKTAYKNVAAETSPKSVRKDFALRSPDTLGFF